MNNNIISMSLPAKPQSKTNIGLLFSPIIMELIGKKIDATKMVTLNTLHSYICTKENVNTYLNDLKEINIKYDVCFEDSTNANILLDIIKILIDNNKIIENKEYIYLCKCGKVEFLKNGLCYNNGKLYSKTEKGLFCNSCNSKVILKKKKVLILKYENDNKKVNVIPDFLSKEMNYFRNLFQNQNILISKSRDTGNYIYINKNKYNIDIEFIWSQLHAINNSDKIMIASNHQVYVMFIINLFNAIYNKVNLLFILTPYIDNNTRFDYFEKKYNSLSEISKKLFLIYSLNWKKKTCSWDLGLYKKIKRLTDKEAYDLYNFLCLKIKYNNFNDLVNKINNFLLREINIDKNLLQIKKINNF